MTVKARYEYIHLKSDQALVHYTEPSLVLFKEMLTMQIPRHINEETQYNQDLEYAPARSIYVSTELHAKVTAETLAERFFIGPERAKETLRSTTQRVTRSEILPIGRRYRADRMFDIKLLSGKFGTDTIWSNTSSITNSVASQIYTHKCGFNWLYHLQRANG